MRNAIGGLASVGRIVEAVGVYRFAVGVGEQREIHFAFAVPCDLAAKLCRTCRRIDADRNDLKLVAFLL